MRYGSVLSSNPNGQQPGSFRTNRLGNGGTLGLSISPVALRGSALDPCKNRCAPGAGVVPLPREPGTHTASSSPADCPIVETVLLIDVYNRNQVCDTLLAPVKTAYIPLLPPNLVCEARLVPVKTVALLCRKIFPAGTCNAMHS